MRGKGQAIVTFDGTQSNDPDGEIVTYAWDFGDGSDTGEGAEVTHAYNTVGKYEATLTVTDNCGTTGQDTADVTIIGATPPATGTPGTPTPEPPVVTSTPDASATVGFCYRVQYGDTLSGVAWRFGVNWQDLAAVNQVPMGYFVIAGQGLFIPTGSIGQGPNVYQTQPGDTLNGVAYNCGLATTTLAQANGLSPTDSLTPGQELVIPVWKP
jgi:LysM repeat protein